MVDLEIELTALEFQWREADDSAKAARAELEAGINSSPDIIASLRKRVDRTERLKQSVMQKMNALEVRIESASFG